ncbi:unnamed protein product [Aphanomyces euteiches]
MLQLIRGKFAKNGIPLKQLQRFQFGSLLQAFPVGRSYCLLRKPQKGGRIRFQAVKSESLLHLLEFTANTFSGVHRILANMLMPNNEQLHVAGTVDKLGEILKILHILNGVRSPKRLKKPPKLIKNNK